MLRAVHMLAGCRTLYRGQRAGAFGCTLKYGLMLLSVLGSGWMVCVGQWFGCWWSGLWSGIVETDCLRLLVYRYLGSTSISGMLPESISSPTAMISL